MMTFRLALIISDRKTSTGMTLMSTSMVFGVEVDGDVLLYASRYIPECSKVIASTWTILLWAALRMCWVFIISLDVL